MLSPLSQALILLAGSVFLVTLVRRLALPTSIAYLVLGLLIGPHALGVLSDSNTTRLLADLGVAFLLFTLGLEFSLPRMLAMRGEVFGLGALQVGATAAVFALLGHLLGIPWLPAIVLGGAVAPSSTVPTGGSPSACCCSRTWRSCRSWRWRQHWPAARTSCRSARISSPWSVAACSPSSRCSRPDAGCCGRYSMRSPTAGCASCSRSPCCWWRSPRPGPHISPVCRSRSARSSPA